MKVRDILFPSVFPGVERHMGGRALLASTMAVATTTSSSLDSSMIVHHSHPLTRLVFTFCGQVGTNHKVTKDIPTILKGKVFFLFQVFESKIQCIDCLSNFKKVTQDLFFSSLFWQKIQVLEWPQPQHQPPYTSRHMPSQSTEIGWISTCSDW